MNTVIAEQNWHVTRDAAGIEWLTLDVPGSVNKISPSVLTELSTIIHTIATQNTAKAVVIRSAKPKSFIAGADIRQFTQFQSDTEALQFIEQGQQVFQELATLSIPTVAVIQGFCLGGGLELALACDYRIAEDNQEVKIGLPEVLLGLHPGWGGTVRLPRLTGAIAGLDLILSGRGVNAKTAAKLGIVDIAVPLRELQRTIEYYALKKPARHQASKLQTLLGHRLLRPLLGSILRRKVAAKVSEEHYPAPYTIINNWVEYGTSEAAFAAEARSLSQLAMMDTARNLIRVFFLQDTLKALGKKSQFKPQHVHVIGAGTMGGDIAAWCAFCGFQVTLQDREPKFIAPAIQRAYKLYQKKLKSARQIQAAMDRLQPDITGLGVAKADIIIEAIYENLEAKQALFKSLEQQAKQDAVFATNTSSIPLDEINVVLREPGRLIGIHFFNPVALMQLVEIVQGNKTLPDNIAKATAFVRQIKHLPLPVTSHPGFLVNRVLMPYLMEAMILLEQGTPAELIDKAAIQFGMPMGPIELADTVGLDVCLAVAENLSSHLGGEVPEKLKQMIAEGKLGRKNGKGFYNYKNGKRIAAKKAGAMVEQPDITDRLILRMLNEAVACLREKVVTDIDLLDAGMIFGTGFAPFRGGPMCYAKTRGVEEIKHRLEELAQKYGKRFSPDKGWALI